MRANQKISSISKTSYGEWCDQHGFKWAEKEIPDEWLTKKKVEKVSKDKRLPLYMQRGDDDHHLSQPFGMFFFRFDWPVDVREVTGKTQRTKSLNTHDLLEARLKRDELLTECKLLVHKVRTNEQSRRKKENIRSI